MCSFEVIFDKSVIKKSKSIGSKKQFHKFFRGIKHGSESRDEYIFNVLKAIGEKQFFFTQRNNANNIKRVQI